MRNNQSLTGRIDWFLVILLSVLIIMGITTLYSVAFNVKNPNLFDISQLYGKQIMWLGIALFIGFIVYLIDSDIYKKFAAPIYAGTMLMLSLIHI